MPFQILEGDMGAVFDAPEETQSWVPSDGGEPPGHRLHAQMVGRHPVAHETERRWQPVEHIDLDCCVLGTEERLDRVERGRACSDDRHPQRASPLGHHGEPGP